MKKRMSSVKSVIKSVRKSDATVLPAIDVVKLNFGELIDLSLGQTEDSANYGAVSFGLLRELLLAIVDRMGVRKKIALAYDSQSPPEVMSAGNSPLTGSSTEIAKRNTKSEILKTSEGKSIAHESYSETKPGGKVQGVETKNQPTKSKKSETESTWSKDQQIEQTESKVKPVNKPLESKVKPVNESLEYEVKPAKSVSQPTEPEVKPSESAGQAIESKEKLDESIDQLLESKVTDKDEAVAKVSSAKQAISISDGALPVDKLTQRLDELEKAVAGLSSSAMDTLKKPLDDSEPDIESRLMEIEKGMGMMMNIFKDMNDKVFNEKRSSEKSKDNEADKQTASIDAVAYNKQQSVVEIQPTVGPEPTALAGLQKQLNKLENKLQTFNNKMNNLDNVTANQKQDLAQFTQLVSEEIGRLSHQLGLCVQWDDLERSLHGKPMKSSQTQPGMSVPHTSHKDMSAVLGALDEKDLPTKDLQGHHKSHGKSDSQTEEDSRVQHGMHSDREDTTVNRYSIHAVNNPSNPALKSSTGQHGQSTGQHGQSTGQHGQSTGQHGQPTGQHGQSTGQHGQSTGQHGQSTGQHGQSTGQHGQSTGQHGQSTGQHGQSTGQHGQSTGQHGQSTGQHGQSTGQHGQSTGQHGQSTGQIGSNIRHDSNLDSADASTRQSGFNTGPPGTIPEQHGSSARPLGVSTGQTGSIAKHFSHNGPQGASSAVDNQPSTQQSSSTNQPNRGYLYRQLSKDLKAPTKPADTNNTVTADKSKSDSRYGHLMRQSEIARLHQQRTPQHGAEFTYVQRNSNDGLAVSKDQQLDVMDEADTDGSVTNNGDEDSYAFLQHLSSNEKWPNESQKPDHIDNVDTDERSGGQKVTRKKQHAMDHQSGAGNRDPSASFSLEKAHVERSPFGSVVGFRENRLVDEENDVMADNVHFESRIKTRPLNERQHGVHLASAQPSQEKVGRQPARHLQGSSVFGVSRSDMDDVKRDGPSRLLRRTLEMLADTPNKQSALGRIIDNLTKNKADKAAVEVQQEINEERILDLQEKSHRQENELVAFREIVQHVSSQKVDRDYLNFALSMKSDKKDIAELIDMKYFKRNMKVLEDALDNLRLKVKNLERESNWKATIDKVLVKVNEKAEKDEVISIKKILQSFESKLNELVQKDFETHTEEAVALRKQMIPFNCLSCSKNVSMDPNKAPLSLPVEGGVTGYKTHRPYTSYELKSIRDQLQEREDVYDPYSAPRPVGGTYTMVDPLKHLRHSKTTTLEETISRGKTTSPPTSGAHHSTINIHNHIVVGQDGKIYKGTQSNKLPDISKKRNPSPSPSSMERTPTVTISTVQNKDE